MTDTVDTVLATPADTPERMRRPDAIEDRIAITIDDDEFGRAD